ncbi:MAG: nitrogen fixation protein NifS [Serratia sp. (in: enterobacteria)]|uniref:nitrogen fixation protein NifS n=1 Tax=Serratia sp. (in: enterobacteria) TaxID=616 RepID=UPI003F2F0C0D
MVSKKIYFIYRPSPTFGRSPIQGAGGGLFGFYKEDKYISVLQDYLNKKNLNWIVIRDDTESDIEKLIEQDAQLLVCAPGIRFQFYRNGFEKKNIIYLSTIEYVSNNINLVVKRIREISNE